MYYMWTEVLAFKIKIDANSYSIAWTFEVKWKSLWVNQLIEWLILYYVALQKEGF
jgi:hypothetical protein